MSNIHRRFLVKDDTSDTGPGAFRDPSKEFGSPESSNHMTPAEIAIVVATVFTLCLGLGFIFWQRNRRQRRRATAAEQMHELADKRDMTPPPEYPPSITAIKHGQGAAGSARG